jgi:hypothetical protein
MLREENFCILTTPLILLRRGASMEGRLLPFLSLLINYVDSWIIINFSEEDILLLKSWKQLFFQLLLAKRNETLVRSLIFQSNFFFKKLPLIITRQLRRKLLSL